MPDCGLGLFPWSDAIRAGRDNREARLWINRCAWKVNRPWIDGAIEGINGVARVFVAGAAPRFKVTLRETNLRHIVIIVMRQLFRREDSPGRKQTHKPPTLFLTAG